MFSESDVFKSLKHDGLLYLNRWRFQRFLLVYNMMVKLENIH